MVDVETAQGTSAICHLEDYERRLDKEYPCGHYVDKDDCRFFGADGRCHRLLGAVTGHDSLPAAAFVYFVEVLRLIDTTRNARSLEISDETSGQCRASHVGGISQLRAAHWPRHPSRRYHSPYSPTKCFQQRRSCGVRHGRVSPTLNHNLTIPLTRSPLYRRSLLRSIPSPHRRTQKQHPRLHKSTSIKYLAEFRGAAVHGA